MGFMPWEKLLSIQIIDTTLNWLTSFTVGLAGLTGLLGFGLNWVGRNLKQYALLVKGIMICLITLISLFTIFTLVVPNFEWKDAYAYRSGYDYLVVQEFEGFVTSNLRNSRVVRTKYPNASVRPIEEQFEVKVNDDRFGRDSVYYEGKIWIRSNINDKSN